MKLNIRLNIHSYANEFKALTKKMFKELLDDEDIQFIIYTNYKSQTQQIRSLARDTVYKDEKFSGFTSMYCASICFNWS